MRFEKAQKSENKINKKEKRLNTDIEFEYKRLYDYCIHYNTAVCLMNPDTKGHFEYLSDLIHDSKNKTPWTIKISHMSERWIIYVGHHHSITTLDIPFKEIISSFKTLDYNIVEFKSFFIIDNMNDKKEVEDIVNSIINVIKNSSVVVLDNGSFNVKYKCEVKFEEYFIPNHYLFNNEFDEQTYRKFLNIISLLDTKNIDVSDKEMFHKIGFRLLRNKYINREERDLLSSLMKKYFSQNERIKIAIRYLGD